MKLNNQYKKFEKFKEDDPVESIDNIKDATQQLLIESNIVRRPSI